jgi:hypothetical protein
MNPILLHNVKYYMHNLNLDFNQTYTGLWYVNMLSVMLILEYIILITCLYFYGLSILFVS